jgi:hypothetical protein
VSAWSERPGQVAWDENHGRRAWRHTRRRAGRRHSQSQPPGRMQVGAEQGAGEGGGNGQADVSGPLADQVAGTYWSAMAGPPDHHDGRRWSAGCWRRVTGAGNGGTTRTGGVEDGKDRADDYPRGLLAELDSDTSRRSSTGAHTGAVMVEGVVHGRGRGERPIHLGWPQGRGPRPARGRRLSRRRPGDGRRGVLAARAG